MKKKLLMIMQNIVIFVKKQLKITTTELYLPWLITYLKQICVNVKKIAIKTKIKIKEEHRKKIIYTICNSCRTKIGQQFPSTYKLCDKNVNKFILLLKKGIYPYEYMDSTDKLNETTLPSIEKFYSKLQLKNITDDEYNHAKKVWEHFEIKTLGDYDD